MKYVNLTRHIRLKMKGSFTLNTKPYFFCYSPSLQKYLFKVKRFNYICEAKNKNDNRTFWLYERTELLNIALTEYNDFFNK